MVEPINKIRFEIGRCLGEGGMGVVYEAYDRERQAKVALKRMHRAGGAALARFKKEFRSLASLGHRNLVALYELFDDHDGWFFSMELLDGVDVVAYVTGREPSAPVESTIRESEGKLSLAAMTPARAAPRGAAFDEPRLRDTLGQLVLAISALHAAGKVHRDVKPSNVIVTREGRVVVVDFGLVVEPTSEEEDSTRHAIVGTPVYMAPEQAASPYVGPAADLYAVGVIVYEILTGRLPFEGGPFEILVQKQQGDPPAPSSFVADLPGDLEALCMRLLSREPSRRPSGEEVLRALSSPARAVPADHGDGQFGVEAVAPSRAAEGAPIFVGRTTELSLLREAYDASRTGSLATVLVCGESGIGKSTLVRHFTRQLALERPDVVRLEGRCYERESIAYKALDGVVDAITRRLSRMTEAEVAAVLPARTAALARVFPVLLRVPRIAKAHTELTEVVEPHELRERAFVALRSLIARIANQRPTVVVIDDLQWADHDGLVALAEILRPPDAPPILLVATVRVAAHGTEDPGLLRVQAAMPAGTRIVGLPRLPREDAVSLAIAVLRRSIGSGADPHVIATEAAGHPLFVEELARHLARGGTAQTKKKLDDAIWSRIEELEERTRAIVEVVAIAGRPIPQEVAAAAVGVDPAAFHRATQTLRTASLVRTDGARWADTIEPYHDRVREAVAARVDPERKRRLHEALATAFEKSEHHDPETLATHWREAGRKPEAAGYAEKAGEQASRALAFDRAAGWYEQALSMTTEDADEEGKERRRTLRVRLGDALAAAGRGALAAPHYEAAAAESTPLDAIDLRRRAAEQLLRCGRFDEGMAASRTVLASAGMRLPGTKLATLVVLLWWTLVLRVRGMGFAERAALPTQQEERLRIDVCWSVGESVTPTDLLLGVAFATRSLLLALRYGDPERIVRAFGFTVLGVATGGGAAWPRTRSELAKLAALAAKSDAPRSRVYATGCAGIALYLSGKFADGAAELRRMIDLVAEGAPDMVFERVTTRHILTYACDFLGQYADLQVVAGELLRDAQARGDLYASVLARTGAPALTWLVGDRPQVCEEHAVDALREWSSGGFHLPHWYGFFARIRTRLYLGAASEAHGLASELIDRASRSLLWRVQINRCMAIYLRAASAVLLARRGPGDRARLLRTAAGDARGLEAQRMGWTDGLAKVIRAGVAACEGENEEAVRRLDEAVKTFEAEGMMGYACAARDRAARRRGGEGSVEETERAAAFFRQQNVVNPERMIGMLVPGLDVE